MLMPFFIDHLLISLVAWFAGMVGGAIGCLCALAARALFRIFPQLAEMNIPRPRDAVKEYLL